MFERILVTWSEDGDCFECQLRHCHYCKEDGDKDRMSEVT